MVIKSNCTLTRFQLSSYLLVCHDFSVKNNVKMMRFHLKRAQCVSTMSNDSQIVNFFKNQTIFLTGGTGLIGKLLVEKLLRTSFDVKKIYILVRAKHGKNCQQRFDHFFNNSVSNKWSFLTVPKLLLQCFEKINQENKSKVSFISGDCSKPDLGLKSEDVDILKTETTCVIHAAANVNFRQTIKEASYNVNSTKEMIKLAKEMNNLKVFVYVSTAYSNCVNNHIREEIYEPPIKAEAFLHLVNSCNEDDLENIFFSYLNKWPNNYVFSKCLSEDLIKNSLLETPIAVVRPSSGKFTTHLLDSRNEHLHFSYEYYERTGSRVD